MDDHKIREVAASEGRSLGDAVYAALDRGLTVLFRVKNHQLDYSITDRPFPGDVSDHLLATALVEAGRDFEIRHASAPGGKEASARDDGRVVRYKHRIQIDWQKRSIRSSANNELTLRVMAIAIENLMRDAVGEDLARGEEAN